MSAELPAPRQYRVLMIVSNMKQYRVEFYHQLYIALAAHGVALKVLYSRSKPSVLVRNDDGNLSPNVGQLIPATYLAGARALLQFPPIRDVLTADYLIVVQANSILMNYIYVLLSRLGLKKVAFWGHGWNRQADVTSFGERFKRFILRQVDWWYAYTYRTEEHLIDSGFSASSITVIDNAIDTEGFRRMLDDIPDSGVEYFQQENALAPTDIVGIYCGALDDVKRIPFLLDCAKEISKRMTHFKLLVVGAGPLRPLVEELAKTNQAIRYLGPRFGVEKALCFRVARVFVHPGAIGLGILDAFAAGLPVMTSAACAHGPEIDYLVDGDNGLMVDGGVSEFTRAVEGILVSERELSRMSASALASGRRYTLENMVANVGRGVCSSLGLEIQTNEF